MSGRQEEIRAAQQRQDRGWHAAADWVEANEERLRSARAEASRATARAARDARAAELGDQR